MRSGLATMSPPRRCPASSAASRSSGELGRGGFGVVFLAEDSLLGRRVAVKVPRVEILTGSESWRRFLREVRAASRLDHPNLVPLLEAGAVGPVGYIVSGYVPGPSLEQWLASRREAATAAMGGEPGRSPGPRHRSRARTGHPAPGPQTGQRPAPRPRPVVSTRPIPRAGRRCRRESWIPRICDFGLAKLHEIEEEETRSRVVCGSPPYMAPEQADSRRDEIGPATDVYGLGTILYELLAGRPPFGGKSNLETLRRVVADEPVPPRRRRPGIPRDLETICLKCLAKRPERRYAAAAALAEDLERFLDGKAIAARPTPAWERASRWLGRSPERWILAAVSLLGIVLGTIGLLSMSARTARPRSTLTGDPRTIAMSDSDAESRPAIWSCGRRRHRRREISSWPSGCWTPPDRSSGPPRTGDSPGRTFVARSTTASRRSPVTPRRSGVWKRTRRVESWPRATSAARSVYGTSKAASVASFLPSPK